MYRCLVPLRSCVLRYALLVSIILLAYSVVQVGGEARAQPLEFDGITFPQGERSFADTVIRYEPLFSGGLGPTSNLAPDETLGLPDFISGDTGFVSLGSGGLVELR